MKLKHKISFVYIIQSFLILSIVGLLSIYLFSNALSSQIYSHLITTVQSRAEHIKTYLDQDIKQLQLVISRTKLRDTLAQYNLKPNEDDSLTMRKIILDAKKPMENIESISILDLNGKVITSTDLNFSNKEIFLKGKEQTEINLIQEPAGYELYLSGPIMLDGELLGVGVMMINLEELEQIIKGRAGLQESGEVLVAFYDTDGIRKYPFERLFESEAIAVSVEGEATAFPMKEALLGKRLLFEESLDYRDEPVIAASDYVELAGLGVVAKIDRKEAFLPLRKLVLMLLLVIIAFLVIVYVTSSQLSYRLTKSIEKLRLGADLIAKGDLDYTVATDRKDEVGALSRSFDSMVNATKASRAEVEKKVKSQTKEILERQQDMEDQQRAVLNILEDVEEEKIKAESLASDLQKFQLAVKEASDHIVITDPEGITLYANRAVEKITGFTEKEVIGKKAGDAKLWGGLMDKSFYEEMWKVIKKDKKVFSGEIRNKRKNGEEYDALASISPILDDGGDVIFFVGIERDVTQEKEIDKAKTEFVSLASHQLRTPLSAVNWYAEMLLAGDAGKINKDQKSYLEEIYNGNQRMVSLVNSLLNVSRLELGTFMVDPEKLSLQKVADNVLEELKQQIKQKKIKVTTKYGKIPKINADPNLTGIIFQNLISNAVKYTPEKGEVSISIQKKSRNIEIKVSDTGYGIPKKQHDKIFSKLFRADNVRKKETEGNGLGLYIVKEIVEHVGGKISFTSKENKGTIFYISMPITGMSKKEGTRSLS